MSAHRDGLLTVADVAEMFGVDPKTVRGWARTGQLRSVRTPGGRLRFVASEVDRLILKLSSG